MEPVPEIVPSLWGEREFRGSQLSRKPLSFDRIYFWSRTMLLSEACGLGHWAGVRQLPSVFTWQHVRVPTAADLLFNHPRDLLCHFLDTVSRQTRKDWPSLSLFRCCGALNLSIMLKFNSSGSDGAHGTVGFLSRWPRQATHSAFGFLWMSDVSQDDATEIIDHNWRPHTTNKPNGKQICYIWPNYNCKYCIKQIAAVLYGPYGTTASDESGKHIRGG